MFYGVTLDGSNTNLVLISQILADSYARAPASTAAPTNGSNADPTHRPVMNVQGYVFAEPKEINAAPDGFASDFAFMGVPTVGGVTGANSFWIGQQGTVWIKGSSHIKDPSVAIEQDTPCNATAASGVWVNL